MLIFRPDTAVWHLLGDAPLLRVSCELKTLANFFKKWHKGYHCGFFGRFWEILSDSPEICRVSTSWYQTTISSVFWYQWVLVPHHNLQCVLVPDHPSQCIVVPDHLPVMNSKFDVDFHGYLMRQRPDTVLSICVLWKWKSSKMHIWFFFWGPH